MAKVKNIENALKVLFQLGMPKAQQNERTALCLLALLNLTPARKWSQAENPLVGITPMMEFSREHYGRKYAPNTRETFRRFSMHQLVAAGIALYNPDNPSRPVNSPKAVYQIEPTTLELLRHFGSEKWASALRHYIDTSGTLASRYAKERDMRRLPVKLSAGKSIKLSPGEHSELIKAIIEEFAQRFTPGAMLVYAGDTGDKWSYFDRPILDSLNVAIDGHGKMPDVILYYQKREWLILVEAVTSHGPVNSKRHAELMNLFQNSIAGLVYVTAFPTRSMMTRYLSEIAWETEVWVADSPTHLIHFNGDRFLGPH